MRELESAGYAGRLTKAISAWEHAHGRVGVGGNQSELARQIAEAFGPTAPSRVAVSKWLRQRIPPGMEYGEMLARVLGVRPAWLFFNDGPMTEAPAEVPREPDEIDELAAKLQVEIQAALDAATARRPVAQVTKTTTKTTKIKRGRRAG